MHTNDMPFNWQEYILVREGMKPLLKITIPSHETLSHQLRVMRSLIERNGMEMLYKNYGFETSVYLSRNFSLAKRALKIEIGIREGKSDHLSLTRKYGLAFGFPECCVDFFRKNQSSAFKNSIPFPLLTYINTKSSFDFVNNNIYNVESRLNEEQNVDDDIHYLYNQAKKHFLISHIPCSYDCNESNIQGRKNLSVLRKRAPDLASDIESSLRGPVLFLGDTDWISFDGRIVGRKIFYHGIKNHVTRGRIPIDSISKGNCITVSDSEICILNNMSEIRSMPRSSEYDGIILDFK